MANFLKFRNSDLLVPDTIRDATVGIRPRSTASQMLARYDPPMTAGDASIVSTNGNGMALRQNEELSGLSQIGVWGEPAVHSWYQTRIAPWVAHPAGQAIVNILASAIAGIDAVQINAKGEEKPLPKIFDYPLGEINNPTFGRPDLWGMTTRNLYFFGTSHTLLYFDGRRLKYVRPVDSRRLQTCGTFMQPFWEFVGQSEWWGLNGRIERNPTIEETPKCSIFPDGRALLDTKPDSESCKYGMLLICLNRTAESNNGVPPGMLNYDGTRAAIEAQKHAGDYFRDGTFQNVMLSPHHALSQDVGMDNLKASNQIVKKQVEATHRAVISPYPYDAKHIGYSAEDSQLVESRAADNVNMAIAHGFPTSYVSNQPSSYASIYGDEIRLATYSLLPIIVEIECEFSRLLQKGWKLRFDRTQLKAGDPMTRAKIAEVLGKLGAYSVDEARASVGSEEIGEEWSQMHYADGNRKPLELIAELTESLIKKQSQPPPEPKAPTGTPATPGAEPEADYPDTPEK